MESAACWRYSSCWSPAAVRSPPLRGYRPRRLSPPRPRRLGPPRPRRLGPPQPRRLSPPQPRRLSPPQPRRLHLHLLRLRLRGRDRQVTWATHSFARRTRASRTSRTVTAPSSNAWTENGATRAACQAPAQTTEARRERAPLALARRRRQRPARPRPQRRPASTRPRETAIPTYRPRPMQAAHSQKTYSSRSGEATRQPDRFPQMSALIPPRPGRRTISCAG